MSAKHVAELGIRGTLPSVKLGHARRFDWTAIEKEFETAIAGQKGKTRHA